MKKWTYTVSTNMIWTSFDYGEVEAETYDEAREKAIAELDYYFKQANEALEVAGLSVGYDERAVTIEEKDK